MKLKESNLLVRQHQNAADHISSDREIAPPAFNISSESIQMQEEEEELQMKKGPAQLMEEEEEEVQMKKAPFQLKEEEEEELQMKQAPFQLREEEEEELQMKQAPTQLMEEEEEELQMKQAPTQLMEEEEEELQMKQAPAQLMEEEEEELQMKQAPTQLMEEEEEELQMKQAPAQMMEEEEEELQMKQAPTQLMEEEEEELQMKQAPAQMMEEEEEELQMKQNNKSSTSESSGATSKTSLPENVQTKMETSFGSDFSSVDIYRDSSKAENIGAQAFAQGNDVHFAPGKYDPQSQSGQELIGHELTHIVQQREGRVQPTAQKKGKNINDNPGLENEADQMGAKAARGEATGLQIGKNKSANQSNQPVQGFFDKIKKFVGKASKAAKKVVKGVKQVGGNVLGSVKKGVNAIGNFAGNIWDRIKSLGGPIGGIVERLLKAGDNIAGIVDKSMRKTIPLIISFLGRLTGVGGISKKVRKLIKKLRGMIGDGVEGIIGKGSKVWKWIKPKVVAARDRLTGGAKKLINFIISVGGSAKDKITKFVESVIANGSSMWETFKGNLQALALYFQRIALPDAEIMGSYQANQAQDKLWAMGPLAFIKFYKSTLGKAKSSREKQYILKALAAGNSIAAIQSFAATIRGKSKDWMRNNLRLTRQTDGNGLRQSWNDSCGPTTVQAIQGELDPIYALSLRNSNGTDINSGNGVVMGPNRDVIEDQRDMLQSNGGVAVSRGSAGGQGMGMGAMMTLIKNRTGIDYTTTGASNKNTALAEIDNILAQGLPVPIRVGASAAAPWGGGHFSLITHKSGSTYNFHDVWQGQSYGRTKANFTTNTMNIANWQIFTHYGKPATDD